MSPTLPSPASDATVCSLIVPTDEQKGTAEPSTQTALYGLLFSASQSSGQSSSAEVPNTKDRSPLDASWLYQVWFSSHWGQMTFWRTFLPSIRASFFPNSSPHESERQRLKTILCLPLKLPQGFLLRLLERTALPDERNLREVLPSSGRHTQKRPLKSRASWSVIPLTVLVCNSTHSGGKALLCSLEIAKKEHHIQKKETLDEIHNSRIRAIIPERWVKSQDVRGYCCLPPAPEQALR